MKRKKLGAIVLMFIFCLSTGLCLYSGLMVRNATSDGVYILTTNKAADVVFNYNAIRLLEKENYYFTFTESLYMKVSTVISTSEVEILGTNENFAHMARLKIISGSFFNDAHIKKSNNIVVLSSAAARQFFGGLQCVGNFISIGNDSYEIIGVVENNYNRKRTILYMPFEDMKKQLSDNPIISEIWIKLHDISEANLIIGMFGHSQDDSQIFPMDQYKNIVIQRFRSVIFITGIIIIVFIWKRMWYSLNILRQELTIFLKENYFTDIRFIFKRKEVLKECLLTVFYVITTLLVFNVIRFKVSLPPNDLLAGRFDLTALIGILNFYFRPNIGIPTIQYLNDLNMLSLVLFFVSIISGFVIAYSIYIILKGSLNREE